MTRLRICLVVIAASLVTACGGNQAMFNPQGPPARSIASLGWLLLTVCAAIYVVVIAIAAWALLRRRTTLMACRRRPAG